MKKKLTKERKFRITYKVPGVDTELAMEIIDTNKEFIKERFERLFKGNTIIKIMEVK